MQGQGWRIWGDLLRIWWEEVLPAQEHGAEMRRMGSSLGGQMQNLEACKAGNPMQSVGAGSHYAQQDGVQPVSSDTRNLCIPITGGGGRLLWIEPWLGALLMPRLRYRAVGESRRWCGWTRSPDDQHCAHRSSAPLCSIHSAQPRL